MGYMGIICPKPYSIYLRGTINVTVFFQPRRKRLFFQTSTVVARSQEVAFAVAPMPLQGEVVASSLVEHATGHSSAQ